jgi:hypothetical protein
MVHGPAATDPRDAASVSPDISPLKNTTRRPTKFWLLAIGDMGIHRSYATLVFRTKDDQGDTIHRLAAESISHRRCPFLEQTLYATVALDSSYLPD